MLRVVSRNDIVIFNMNRINNNIPKMAENHIYTNPTATPWGNK